nr:hypothetical protein [Mycoplasmopsis bovis]
MKPAIKEAIVAKVPTLKDKELKLNADLSKKSVTVSAKDFEGEVTLKFEIEAKSVAKPKLSETLKSITGNDLGKVQVAEQDKSNKEKIEGYQRSYCCKSSNTKRQGIKIKRWFKQEKRNCFC